jgi:uncharacterized cupin superfamily protein
MGPIASNNMDWQEWSAGPRFGSRIRHLTRAALGNTYNVGFVIEELAPARQSVPAHYHVFEEEHLFVLYGEATLRLGADTHTLRAGDYAIFPAGQDAAHCLINTAATPFRFVMIGEHKAEDVVHYPDSGKVQLRAKGVGECFHLGKPVRYWEGENTGLNPGEMPTEPYGARPADPPPIPPCATSAISWEDEAHGTQFGGRVKRLTQSLVGTNYRVGLRIESPSPGKRLCPLHYHMLEEEHALVLEGCVTLLLGDETHTLTEGDYVAFPAGRKIGHAFMNRSDQPCAYLMIGQRNPAEVCIYPQSNKMAVDALGPDDSIFDMAARKSYWDGEAPP